MKCCLSVEYEFLTLSGSEWLVDAVGFSRVTGTSRTGASRAVLRRSGALGDHTVPRGGHSWICADPLYNAGQTVETGNERPLASPGLCNKVTHFFV